MNNLIFKLLPIILVSFLTFSVFSEESTEEEVDQPSNPQELLEIVKQGQFADSQEQRERERKFRSEKNKQTKLLSDAKAYRARLEREAARLEQIFEANEELLVVAEAQLKERLGSLNEIFGHLAGLATEARNIFEQSISSAQFGKEREEFLTKLAVKMGEGVALASIPELERLWYELQREINASGEVIKFTTDVIALDGTVESRDVVRVGVFNAITENFFLKFIPETQSLQVLARQPARRFRSLADDLFDLEDGYTTMAVDPSRGQILGLLIQAPGIGERINQGGVVGYFIIFIGLLGLMLSGWRLKLLKDEGDAINRQLKSDQASDDNALGRILSVFNQNQDIDPESLELKIDEAILREVPKLEKFHSIIKVFAAVAPLLGLLGTVVGMIVTFQALTLFGTGDPKLMAGGISQALVTTMLGLIVAIPLVFLHSILTSWSGSLIEIIEEQSAGLIARNAGNK